MVSEGLPSEGEESPEAMAHWQTMVRGIWSNLGPRSDLFWCPYVKSTDGQVDSGWITDHVQAPPPRLCSERGPGGLQLRKHIHGDLKDACESMIETASYPVTYVLVFVRVRVCSAGLHKQAAGLVRAYAMRPEHDFGGACKARPTSSCQSTPRRTRCAGILALYLILPYMSAMSQATGVPQRPALAVHFAGLG